MSTGGEYVHYWGHDRFECGLLKPFAKIGILQSRLWGLIETSSSEEVPGVMQLGFWG